MSLKKLSNQEIETLIEPMIGLPISSSWQGYGSAIFFELGKLSSEKLRNKKGEASINIEWDWRVNNHQSILYGSSNSRNEIEKGLNSLKNTHVTSIEFENDVLDIKIKLSNGHIIRSATMKTGDPQ